MRKYGMYFFLMSTKQINEKQRCSKVILSWKFFKVFYIIQDRSRHGLRKYINEKLCKYIVERQWHGESKSNFLAKSLLFQKPSPSAARFTPYHNANASKTDVCSGKLKILQQICQIQKNRTECTEYTIEKTHSR